MNSLVSITLWMLHLVTSTPSIKKSKHFAVKLLMAKEIVSSSIWNVSIVVCGLGRGFMTDLGQFARYPNVFANAKTRLLLCVTYGSYRDIHGVPKSLVLCSFPTKKKKVFIIMKSITPPFHSSITIIVRRHEPTHTQFHLVWIFDLYKIHSPHSSSSSPHILNNIFLCWITIHW